MRFVLVMLAVICTFAFSAGVGGVIYSLNQADAAPPHITKVATPEPPADAVVLMVFGSPSCQPCLEMKPIINKLRYDGQYIEDVDTEHQSQIAQQWGVSRTPTYIAVRGGCEIGHRIVGKTTEAKLRALVEVDVKIASEPQPERPHPIRSLVTGNASDDKPAEGAQGWRLRLFYPRGDAEGERLKSAIGRMTNVAAKYGFEADTTDSDRFRKSWRPYGYPRDKITIVLVRDDNTVVYYQHKFPSDVKQLRDEIRAAAAGDVSLAAEFDHEIGGNGGIKER